MADTDEAARDGQRSTSIALVCCSLGLLASVAAVWLFGGPSLELDANGRLVLSFAATWIPMLAAVLVCRLTAGRQATSAILALRIHGIDVLWGLGVGILLRCFSVFLGLVVTGSDGIAQGVRVGPIDGWYVFGALVAPVILSPFIEETFFRGLMQGSISARLGERMGRAGSSTIAIGVTSLVFLAVHLSAGGGTVSGGGSAWVVGTSLFVFAVAVGCLRALTGRIGGAIIAHVVFNATAVLLTWPR